MISSTLIKLRVYGNDSMIWHQIIADEWCYCVHVCSGETRNFTKGVQNLIYTCNKQFLTYTHNISFNINFFFNEGYLVDHPSMYVATPLHVWQLVLGSHKLIKGLSYTQQCNEFYFILGCGCSLDPAWM